MTDMQDIASRLARVQAALRAAEHEHGRAPGSVALVAVSKTQGADAIAAAYAAGQRAFGENYVQEALAKQAALTALPLEWHFIGPLQGNKTAEVAANFSWVHSVDRLRIAERLSRQRPEGLPPLNVLIQVNISGEASKHGVAPEALPALAAQVADLPRLRLRGLMALPEPTPDFALQRAAFRALAELLRACPVPMDSLSMGTTDDFAAAIAEGATMVRIGTAVFGPRVSRA